MSYSPPAGLVPQSVLITPWSECSLGPALGPAAASTGTATSVAWPTANMTFYYPFYLVEPIVVMKLFWANGATVNGNTDVGIYDPAGNRLTSSTPQLKAGASVIQEFNITDIVVGRGLFYIGVGHSNNTGTFQGLSTGSTAYNKIMGIMQQAVGTLPNPATFAAVAGTIVIPLAGLSARTLVA